MSSPFLLPISLSLSRLLNQYSSKFKSPQASLYGFNLDDTTSERDNQARFGGLNLDLSSLQNDPSSPQDGGFTSVSTPSLSNTSNAPTTPQDSHSRFSSFSAGSKTPEDDPSVWVNPALRNQLGRSVSIQPERINDDVQFTDRAPNYRPSHESPHSDPFHVKSFSISPGFLGPINDDSVAQLGSARGPNRFAVQSNDIQLEAYPQTAWMDPKESVERSKPVGTYGADPRAELEASMHAFHGVSPYTQGRLHLPPSPATHTSTLFSTNDLFSQHKNRQYPTNASSFVPNFPQLPHALTSSTPRPLPTTIAATISATQFLPPAGLSPPGDIFQDISRSLQASDALVQPSFPPAFDSFPRTQNLPASSPRHLSQGTPFGHNTRTPPAPAHEVSMINLIATPAHTSQLV